MSNVIVVEIEDRRFLGRSNHSIDTCRNLALVCVSTQHLQRGYVVMCQDRISSRRLLDLVRQQVTSQNIATYVIKGTENCGFLEKILDFKITFLENKKLKEQKHFQDIVNFLKEDIIQDLSSKIAEEGDLQAYKEQLKMLPRHKLTLTQVT